MKKREYKIAILRRSLDHLYTKKKHDDHDRLPNVCGALDYAYSELRGELTGKKDVKKLLKAVNALLDTIGDHLLPHTHVSGWLLEKGVDVREYAYEENDGDSPTKVDLSLVRYRRKWVKAMIATLERGEQMSGPIPWTGKVR